MFRKTIYLISILLMLGTFVSAEYNLTHVATKSCYSNVTNNDSRWSSWCSEEDWIITRSGAYFGQAYWGFDNITTWNATDFYVSCYGTNLQSPYWGVKGITVRNEEQPLFASDTCWDETMNAFDSPFYAQNASGWIDGCNHEIQLNESRDLWDTFQMSFVGSPPVGEGNFTWQTIALDEPTYDWENYTGDWAFGFRRDLNDYTIGFKKSVPCNITITYTGEAPPTTTTTIPVTNITLYVNVSDSVNTSVPIENVTVYINNNDGVAEFTQYTNSSGEAVFNITELGEYTIQLTHQQYESFTDSVLLFWTDKIKLYYLEQKSNDVVFNISTYDKDSLSSVENVKLEFIQCQGGETPFLDCAINYPDGNYNIISTQYTDGSGNFVGTIDEMSRCFVIGFRKEGYVTPDVSVFLNSYAVCIEDSWYSESYTMPPLDMYMQSSVDNVIVTYIIRDKITYARIENANVTVFTPTEILTGLTDSNGEIEFINDIGCWDTTVTKSLYYPTYQENCWYYADEFEKDLFMLYNLSEPSANISTYNITGFIVREDNESVPVKLADIDYNCYVDSPTGRLWEIDDLTVSANDGSYSIYNVYEGADCDILVSKNGYDNDVGHISSIDSNTELNISLGYTGKKLDVDGFVTDCVTNLPIPIRVQYHECDSENSNCRFKFSQRTGDDGHFDLPNVDEGWTKLIYTATDYDELEHDFNLQNDMTFFKCLYPAKAKWWLKGVVLNQTLEEWGVVTSGVEANVKVYDFTNNALKEQVITSVDGHFAFLIREDKYTITATAQGKSATATVYLDHDFNTEELEMLLSIGGEGTRDFETEEFLDTMTGLLPSVIVLFIFLMIVQGFKNVAKW